MEPHEYDAVELLGRMKADGLITQRKDGTIILRSYGRAALVGLATVAAARAVAIDDPPDEPPR